MTCQQLVDFLVKDLAINPSMANRPIFAQNGGEIHGIGMGGERSPCLTHDYRPVHTIESRWEFFEAIFKLARIPIAAHWEIANGYWPDAYTALRLENPWWLVKTPVGLLEVGWRKRVISIDWSDTPIRAIVTGEDQTTTHHSYCHAWPVKDNHAQNAVRYLRVWGSRMDELLDK